MKATFELSIWRKRDQVAVFNTKLSPVFEVDDWVKEESERTVCMSTYLIAFVVAENYSTKELNSNTLIPIRVVAPEHEIGNAHFALEVAHKVMEKYTSYLGYLNPIKKLDLVAVPGFDVGPMENWGLVTFGDNLVDNATAMDTKAELAGMIAHELAHQWFGNLVTMKWWNEIWLNEGIATFMQRIGAEVLDKKLKLGNTPLNDIRETMKDDSLISTHAVHFDINNNNDEIKSSDDNIADHKSSCLVNVLRNVIGDDALRKGFHLYLETYAFRNVDQDNLLDSLEKFAKFNQGFTLKEFMNSWLKLEGYPLVTVTRNGNKVTLTQERFLLTRESSELIYIIPFTYTSSSMNGTVKSVWISGRNTSFNLPSKDDVWIMGNVNSQGYYRVNYDTAGWRAIAKQLKENFNVFSVEDRLALLDDAFTIAKVGKIGYDSVFELCRYLEHETDVYIWRLVASNVNYLIYRLQGHSTLPKLKMFFANLVNLTFTKIDRKENRQSRQHDFIDKFAIECELQEAIDYAMHLFKNYKAHPELSINLEMLRAAINFGNDSQSNWDLVYQRYQAHEDDQMRSDGEDDMNDEQSRFLVDALAGSKNASNLKFLLDEIYLKHEIVPVAIATNPVGYKLVWDRLSKNWDYYNWKYHWDEHEVLSAVEEIMTHFNTEKEEAEAIEFAQGRDLDLSKAFDYLAVRVFWRKTQLKGISSWLNHNV